MDPKVVDARWTSYFRKGDVFIGIEGYRNLYILDPKDFWMLECRIVRDNAGSMSGGGLYMAKDWKSFATISGAPTGETTVNLCDALTGELIKRVTYCHGKCIHDEHPYVIDGEPHMIIRYYDNTVNNLVCEIYPPVNDSSGNPVDQKTLNKWTYNSDDLPPGATSLE